MKDERIIKELNNAKGVVLYYIFLSTIIISVGKYFLYGFDYELYRVEIFIIALSGSSIILKFLFYKQNDERLELEYEKIINILFGVLIYGGFFIHFYSASTLSSSSPMALSFTSTFILIGAIIFVIQLKKREIYANQKWIELSKSKYILKILKNLGIFGLVFTLNVIPYIINSSNILVGLLSIFISFVSLSVSYLLFALYEKNHFDEETLFIEGKYRKVTKNAILLYIIPFTYYLLATLVNIYYNYLAITTNSMADHMNIAIIQEVSLLYRLDITILITVMYYVIYFHVKKHNAPRILLNLINIYAILNLMLGIISYTFTLLSPVILTMINNVERIMQILSIYTNVSIGLALISFSIILIFILNLKKLTNTKTIYLFLNVMFSFLALAISRISFGSTQIPLLLLTTLLYLSSHIFFFIFLKSQERLITLPNISLDV